MGKKQKVKTSNENEKMKHLHDLFIEALTYAEDNNIPWQNAVVMGTFHILEFSCYKSNGNITEIFSLMTHAMSCSAFKRVNDSDLDDLIDHLDVRIGLGEKVKGQENQASAIIISFVQQTLEALLKNDLSHFQRLH
mgnify:CR=1 FL=1